MNAGRRYFVLILFVLLAVYHYPLRYLAFYFLLTQLHLHAGVLLFLGVNCIWGRLLFKMFFRRLTLPSLWERTQLYLVFGFLLTGQVFILLRIFPRVSWELVWLGFLSYPAYYIIRQVLNVHKNKEFLLKYVSFFKNSDRLRAGEGVVLTGGAIWLFLFLVSAQFPPVSYDGLSYHLAIPHWWLQGGFVSDYPYNLYSAMPFHWQSVYALFTLFTGQSGQYLHIIVGLLGVLNAGYLLYRIFKIPLIFCVSACFFLFSLPEFYYLSRQANIDLGLFYVLSVITLVIWNRQDKTCRSMAVFWLLAFLAGTKYTALLLFIVPFFIADFIRYRDIKRIIQGGIIVLLLNTIHFVKNLVLYRNPFYPLFGFFGEKEYYDYSFFLEHHTPGWREIFQPHLLTRPAFLFPVLALAVVVYFISRSSIREEWQPGINFSIIFSLFSWLFYGLFTVGTARFIFPVWAVLLPVIAVIFLSLKLFSWRMVQIPAIIFFLFSFYWQNAVLFSHHPHPLSYFSGLQDNEKILETHLPEYGGAVLYINNTLGEEAILFIGEARTYFLERPGNVTYNTVFNYNPAALIANESPDYDVFMERLKNEEWRYILVNEIELMRLADFYGDIWQYLKPGGKQIWFRFLEQLSEEERIYEYSPSGEAGKIYIVELPGR